ncbi:pseudouridine synthase [Algoriphagus hitonicola]|uniref:Pseudouridine synthase n=1 Tax=Algoriphagus hitonicola TaxID=435880 RepID=A0A1I2RVT2_9BACT|nr:pseudouridine synthase [Algoriphagus hitonicola]SFG44652.1 23S rRNA pseudouridine2605 synthase [Algoriphagus hitonicola]
MKKDNSKRPFFSSKSDSEESKSNSKSKFSGKDDQKRSPKKFDGKRPSGSRNWKQDENRDQKPRFQKEEDSKFPKRTLKPRPDFAKDDSPKKFEKKFEKGDRRSDREPQKQTYLGRGKDQKPIFGEKEFIKKTTGNTKVGFGKNRKNTPKDDLDRPDYNFDALPSKKSKDSESGTDIRLNKYIANSGICSRREADQMISKGLISVNNEVITELGYKVKKSDRVVYNGKRINPEKPVYLLLNKPKDFITTTDDPMDRKTVMNLVGNACEERIFPVGRLDRNTTGLLLFTNDGELAAKLSHPSNEIKKIYQVTLDKPLTKKDEEAIIEGLTLEDGPANVDDMQVLSKDRTILGLEIHIGRNRIVRRIFAHLGYDVTALDRVLYAGLDKKDLKRGHYRFLSEKEVIKLKFFI